MRQINRHDLQGALPAWVSDAVRAYLEHTGAGVSIRDIARASQCHASTISRRIRKIEQQRDDPLIDAALRHMEASLKPNPSQARHADEKDLEAMSMHTNLDSTQDIETLEKEAGRILRRLCETGAVLAIAADMDTAVVVRETPEAGTTRTGVVAQEIAQAMAVQGWIETSGSGRILRYKITQAGRDKVRELLGDTTAGQAMALAEAPAPFAGAEAIDGIRSAENGRRSRYALAESPLTVLARRRDKTGEAFLGDDLVRCGERLREDFELAQMGTRTTQNWDNFLTAGVETGGARGGGFGPDAARARVVAALKDLGPGLSDVALQCCCYLEGLEATEKRMGWSARSGKIVLRIALQRLKRHYEETLTPEAQMIG